MQRNFNWLGNQRLDIPHLRMVESAVQADFQLLAGQILAGGSPVVVKGFDIQTAIGGLASSLYINSGSSIVLHASAAESGCVFSTSASVQAELLNSTNPNVIGSFAPGTNYVGMDLVRVADTTTADQVTFLSDATQTEFQKTVPLGRTLQYRYYIQATDFDHTPNILPLAIVVVSATETVVSITDARQMAFRLGKGGTLAAARTPFFTLSNRAENPITTTSSTSPFTGGDKGISSYRDWMGFVMNRLWEVGGGEYWYSPTADKELKLIRSIQAASLFTNGENFEVVSSNLHWKGLKIAFGHSTGWYNIIADQITSSAGLTDLAAGQCLYVDLDRTQNATVTAVRGTLTSLGLPTVPGSRYIIAWRGLDDSGTQMWCSRDSTYPVGYIAPHATTTSYGICELSAFLVGDSQTSAIVPVVDSTSRVVASGITNPGAGAAAINIGTGSYDSTVNIGVSGGTTTLASTLSMSGTATASATGTNATLTLQGNRSAGDTGTDIVLASQATRNAGSLLAVKNGATAVLTASPTGIPTIATDAYRNYDMQRMALLNWTHPITSGQYLDISANSSGSVILTGGTSVLKYTNDAGQQWSDVIGGGTTKTWKTLCYSPVLDSFAGCANGNSSYIYWASFTSGGAYGDQKVTSSGSLIDINSIAWSTPLDMFVGVGDSSANAKLSYRAVHSNSSWLSSSLGAQGTIGTTLKLNRIVWVDTLGLFVAVGENGLNDLNVYTTSDGINWNPYALAGAWKGLTWSSSLGKLVTVGINSCYVSTNGTTWVSKTIPTGNWNSVTWTGIMFVAVGNAGKIAFSPDAETWTAYNCIMPIATGATPYTMRWINNKGYIADSSLGLWQSIQLPF